MPLNTCTSFTTSDEIDKLVLGIMLLSARGAPSVLNHIQPKKENAREFLSLPHEFPR
jgi:hypothetical protein